MPIWFEMFETILSKNLHDSDDFAESEDSEESKASP